MKLTVVALLALCSHVTLGGADKKNPQLIPIGISTAQSSTTGIEGWGKGAAIKIINYLPIPENLKPELLQEQVRKQLNFAGMESFHKYNNGGSQPSSNFALETKISPMFLDGKKYYHVGVVPWRRMTYSVGKNAYMYHGRVGSDYSVVSAEPGRDLPLLVDDFIKDWLKVNPAKK